MWWCADEPQLLRPGYVTRTTLLRLALLWLAAYNLDTAFQAQGDCPCSATSISSCSIATWRKRAGLAGLQLQILLSAWAVVWPFLHMLSFERHHKTLQQVLAYGTIAGKVLKLYSGIGHMLHGAACQQAMLLHSILFALQQDQQYPTHLATMLVAYSGCELLAGPHSLLSASSSGWLGQGSWAETSAAAASRSSNAVVPDILSASRFYLIQYMVGLLVFNAAMWFAPMPETLTARIRGSSSRSSEAKSQRPSSAPSSSAPSSPRNRSTCSRPASMDGFNSTSSCSKGFRPSACSSLRSTGSGSTDGISGVTARLELRSHYMLKLLVVKAVDAAFFAVLAVHYCGVAPGQQPTKDGVGLWGLSAGASSRLPALLAAAVAALQVAHGISVSLAPHWFQRRALLVNAMFFYPGVVLRVWLLFGNPLAAAATVVQGILGSVPGLAFAAFLVMAISLASHEDARLPFMGQLTLLAVGLRQAHLRGLAHSTQQLAGVAATPWLPEYLMVCVLMACFHGWLCVGKYQQLAGVRSAHQSRSNWRDASSLGTVPEEEEEQQQLKKRQVPAAAAAAAAAAGAPTSDGRIGTRRRSSNLRCSSATSLSSLLQVDISQEEQGTVYTQLQGQPLANRAASRRASCSMGLVAPPSQLLGSATATHWEGRPGEAAGQPPSRRAQRRSILWADDSFDAEQLGKEQPISDALCGPTAAVQGLPQFSTDASASNTPASGSAADALHVHQQPQAAARRGMPPAPLQITTQPAGVSAAEAVSQSTPSSVPDSSSPSQVPSHQTFTPTPAPLQRLSSVSSPRPTSPRGSLHASRQLSRQALPRLSASGAVEDGTSEEAPDLQAEQRMVVDLMMGLMGLPVALVGGLQLLKVAWHGSTAAGPVGRALGAVTALLYTFNMCPYLLHMLWDRRGAYARRQVAWLIAMGAGPFNQEAAKFLLRMPPSSDHKPNLVVLAFSMGMAQLNVPTFSAWHPFMFVTFFSSHVYHNWSAFSWARLGFELAEFNLYPVAAYLFAHWATRWLQSKLHTGVPQMLTLLGIKRKNLHRVLSAWVGGLALTIASNLLLTLLILGPGQWPAAMSVMGSLQTAKSGLLGFMDQMSEQGALQGALAALAVLCCCWIAPCLHLAGSWLWARLQPHRTADNMQEQGQASSDARLYSKQELKRQQQIGVDTIGYFAAAPWVPLNMLTPLLATIWAAPGVAVWQRVLAACGGAAQMSGFAARIWDVWHQPDAALSRRHMWWGFCHVSANSVFSFGTQLVKSTGFLPPLANLLISAGFLGMMDIRHSTFATHMFVGAPFFFAAYVYPRWSETAWSVLAYDALECSVYPTVLFALTRLVNPVLNRTVVRYIMEAALHRGYITNPQQHKQWAVWSAMGSINAIALIPGWGAALGVKLPSMLDPRAAQAALKAEVVGMFSRMEFDIADQMDTMHTLLAMAAVGVCFLAVSSVQALLLNNPAFQNPRQRKYEACKARVTLLGERTMSSLTVLGRSAGPQQLKEALLSTLREVTEGCFPGCTLLVVLMEDKDSLYEGMARRYLVHAAPEAADMPHQDLLALSELSSVVQACDQGTILYDSNTQTGPRGHQDWDALAADYGMDGFLVAPLFGADQAMGALLLTSTSPVTLDKYLRKLAGDLATALSQALYTLSCIEQMKAGQQIIHDILPEKVAEELRRRAGRQEHVMEGQQQQQSRELEAGLPTSRSRTPLAGDTLSSSASGFGQVPVVYKQWHPAVSVLFADISSYTAMSQQVEPEQVMQLLHELFSKYDNLCSLYGVYKVETIGDCYMACCGLLTDDPDHATHIVQFGQAMLGAAASVVHPLGGHVRIRVGIHSGRVMSGVVGSIRARYCLFGDTVNTASRMESTGVVDHIQITEDTYQLLSDLRASFELRDPVAVKGKGVMHTYLLRSEVAEQLQEDPLTHLSL